MADVTATLGGDITPFKRAMNEAREETEKFRKEISSGVTNAFAEAAAFGGIAEGVKGLLEYGEQLHSLSEQYGVSTDALQKFGNAAKLNGVELESVANGFKKLEVSQSQAINGSKEQIEAFSNLGISIDDLKTLSPEQLMLKLGKSSLDAADAVKILGRNALELRPTLQQLADGSAQLGQAMDKETVRSLAEANKKITELQQTMTVVGGTIVGSLINPLVNAAKTLGAVLGGLLSVIQKTFEIAASASFKSLKSAGAEELEALKSGFKGAAQTIKDIWAQPEEKAIRPRAVAGAAEEDSGGGDLKAVKYLSDVERLQKELNDLRANNAEQEMTDQQKLADIERRRIDLAVEAGMAGEDKVKGLNAQIELEKLVTKEQLLRQEMARKKSENAQKDLEKAKHLSEEIKEAEKKQKEDSLSHLSLTEREWKARNHGGGHVGFSGSDIHPFTRQLGAASSASASPDQIAKSQRETANANLKSMKEQLMEINKKLMGA